MSPRKSVPKGINPAYPNRNFVEMTYTNKGDKDGFFQYMHDGSYAANQDVTRKPHNVHGHGVGQRAGRLRLSGKSGAHRIGKRG